MLPFAYLAAMTRKCVQPEDYYPSNELLKVSIDKTISVAITKYQVRFVFMVSM